MFFKLYKKRNRDYSSSFEPLKKEGAKNEPSPKVIDEGEEDEEAQQRVIDINNADDIAWELERRAGGGLPNDIEIINDALVVYKGDIVDVSQLPSLLCEECERRDSVLKCETCDQIFCPKCYNLCHMRPKFGTAIHPHETDKDLFVRPINEEDTSSVVVDNKFYLPDYECHEEYLKTTHDITQPNTLATTQHYKSIDKIPENRAVTGLLYKGGDILVYIDPVTKNEVYGRVESEWDFRHDKSAPTLIRGEGGGLTWYVVRYLGEASPAVLELLEADRPPDYDEETNKENQKHEALMLQLPNLEGVGSTQLRLERLMANRINKRVEKVKKIRKYGPKHHLNPSVPKGFEKISEDDDTSVGAFDEHSSLCCGSIGGDRPATSSSDVGMHISRSEEPKIVSTKKLTAAEIRQANLPQDNASRRTLDGVVAAYSYINEIEAELNHEVFDENEIEPEINRRLKILLLPESSLTKPSDRLKLLQLRKKEKIRRALVKRFALMFDGWTSWAFSGWKDHTDQLRYQEQYRCATLVQKHVRRFQARNLIEELKFKSSALMHERWKKLHAKFNYCRSDTPGAVTMDNKVYFSSIRDVNAYGRALRVSLSRFMRVAEKRRLDYLTESLRRWKIVIRSMQEYDLSISHLVPFETVHDLSKHDGKRVNLESRTAAVHKALHDDYIRANIRSEQKDIDWDKVDANPADDSRLDLNSMLMGIERKDQGEAAPPPWHPSVGFSQKLPLLPKLPNLVINNKNAPINKPYPHSLEDIQQYNSFREKFKGPTDFSFWVIPGRLAMGKMPLGRARRIGPVDSSLHTMIDCIPQLIMAGITSFVSTMTPEEEKGEIKDYNKYLKDNSIDADPVVDVKTRIEEDHNGVCASIKESIFNLNLRIDDKNLQLKDYSHIEDAPLRAMKGEQMSSVRVKHKAEKVRLIAKKWLLQDDVKTAKEELERVTHKPNWDNYPFVHNEAPLYEKMISVLWDIEQRLYNGENIYLYSKEGKGRSGMVCALVLGRLYGLSPTETLLRMQTYFDCQKSQYDRKVSANCPQMRRQQDLVTRILQSSNMVYGGILYRSEMDPETFLSENQRLKAGTQTHENEKEYVATSGGHIQKKVSFVMKQKPPTEKFKVTATAVLENASSTFPLVSVNKKEIECNEKRNADEVKERYVCTTLPKASKALARPVEKLRPVYCDRPSQVHIDKTFSKQKKKSSL